MVTCTEDVVNGEPLLSERPYTETNFNRILAKFNIFNPKPFEIWLISTWKRCHVLAKSLVRSSESQLNHYIEIVSFMLFRVQIVGCCAYLRQSQCPLCRYVLQETPEPKR